MTTALIFGASGLVGTQLLKFLSEDSTFDKIIVIARKPLTIACPKVEQRIFSDLFDATFENVDSVFCSLGTTIANAGSKAAFFHIDHDLVVQISKICTEKRCRYLGVVSAIGADSNSFVFYNRTKGQMENAVSSLGIPSVSFVRPSLLLGDRSEQRAGEKIGIALSKLISPVLTGFLAKYHPVKAESVARCLIAESKLNILEIRTLEWVAKDGFTAKPKDTNDRPN